jgi:MFS transporter, MCT family, aspergillic acid transporter
MVSGSSLGGVIFPIMISRLIASVGYPWALRSAAFLVLALQAIAITTVRPREKVSTRSKAAIRFAAPFKEKAFVLLLAGVLVLTCGIFVPVTYVGVQGFQEAHMSEDMAQYLVAIFNGAR